MKTAIEALQIAAEAGSFMAAIWYVKDGKVIPGRNTTWQFPTGDFDTAIKQMQTICDEKKAECDMPSFGPLPMADFLPKKKPLLGSELPEFPTFPKVPQEESVTLKVVRPSEEESQPPKGEQCED